MNKPIHGVKNTHVGPPRMSPSTSGNISKVTTVEAVKKQISLLKSRLERRNIKVSKAAESYVYFNIIFNKVT